MASEGRRRTADDVDDGEPVPARADSPSALDAGDAPRWASARALRASSMLRHSSEQ